jgi:hypothetical protein
MTIVSYASHGPWTDPGPHSAAIDALPTGVGSVVETVQGLLIHDAGLQLYGLGKDDFAGASRETRPVAERLAAALSAGPLSQARAPRDRAFGTCRDYALMTTALLRHRGVPARVRCGFATYFRSVPFADHWICERWTGDRWARTDAQLDAPHQASLAIGFDPSDMPNGAFLTAGEAWTLVHGGAADPADFGLGEARGEWCLRINLARDLLALGKHEVSPWDGWRAVRPEIRPLDADARAWCDAVAEAAAAVDRDPEPLAALAERCPAPFWL